MNWDACQARTNAAVSAAFGRSITLDGGAVVQALFDSGYALGDVGASGMATTQPTLVMESAAAQAIAVGQGVTVDGVRYTVGLQEPDGMGMTRLRLDGVA